MLLTRLLTLRSLRSRPLRMFLSAFGIVLGVAGMVAIGITNHTALASVTTLFTETSGRANLVVVNAKSSDKGFSSRILSRVESFPGVLVAAPTIQVQTLLADEDEPAEIGMSFFGASVGGLALYGIDPAKDRQARTYQMVAGDFLAPNAAEDQVVLVESFADEKEIDVGDTIKIIAGDSIARLDVVGLMARDGPGQINNGAFGVLPLETAQKLFGREGKLDHIDIIVAPELTTSDGLEKVRSELQAKLGEDFDVIYPASQGKRMTQMLGNYQIGLNFLSAMALFVGAFLIYNAFSMNVVDRTREFGMLRTVGMTRAQVTFQVLFEALMLGIVGSGAGVGSGLLMAGGLAQVMERLLGIELVDFIIPVDILISSGVVGLCVTLAAAALPALQAGRISPMEALRIRAARREGWMMRNGWWFGAALLAISAVILVLNPFPYDVQFRLGSMVVLCLFLGGTLTIPASVGVWERVLRPVIRVAYGSSGQLGSGNIQRARLRTTLTVAALMVGVTMIIVVWVITGSFKNDMDEWLKGYIGGDLYVTSSLPIREAVWRRLEAEEGVAAVAPVRYFQTEWLTPEGKKETVSVMGFDPRSYNQVTSFVFSQEPPDKKAALEEVARGDAVFISTVLSEKYQLNVGDRVWINTRSGVVDFQIAGVVVDYYNQGMVIDLGWGNMARYFRERDANTLLVSVTKGFAPDTVKDQLESRYGDRYHLVFASNQSILDRVSRLMEQAFSMFDILAVIAMLVAFFGITNTLTMNVVERIQEIGMLRSIGMTRGQLTVMILAEAGLMGVIGGILGLAFGVILARIFLAAMTAMSGYRIAFALPLERGLAALLMAVVVANLAALLPAARAARTRILDAIHYE